MPRILSRSSLQSNSSRRHSMSSRANLSKPSEMNLLAQWLSSTDIKGCATTASTKSWSSNQSSTVPSVISTGSSTPQSLTTLRKTTSTLFSNSQSQPMPRRRSSCYLPTPEMDPPDAWGQFIDVAEADELIVRHSRILSAKANESSAAMDCEYYRWQWKWMESIHQPIHRCKLTLHITHNEYASSVVYTLILFAMTLFLGPFRLADIVHFIQLRCTVLHFFFIRRTKQMSGNLFTWNVSVSPSSLLSFFVKTTYYYYIIIK